MRLVIIEDDPYLLERLSIALDEEAGISVAGAFGTAREALTSLGQLSPDVMLVDLGLPDLSGVELIRRVRYSMPDVEILAHTVFDDKDTVFSAIRAGASGYILKGTRLGSLVEALHEVREGGAPMTPAIARKVVREFRDGGPSVDEDDDLLTPREKAVLKEIEAGMTYKQTASKLNISSHTVNVHIRNIYQKLQAKDRKEALRSARRKGIL